MAELLHRLRLTSIPVELVQRRLRWFGHAARHPDGELIKHLLQAPTSSTYRRTGYQLKTWPIMIKADLETLSGPRVFGYARWRKEWAKVSSGLA